MGGRGKGEQMKRNTEVQVSYQGLAEVVVERSGKGKNEFCQL